METPVTPEQVLADAEAELTSRARRNAADRAAHAHTACIPGDTDHSDLPEKERQNKIIGEVLSKISDDHCDRNQLMSTIQSDLAGITQFIVDKKIVSLGPRDNLKVVPTPLFLRGIYSVAGFHSAPPLDPSSEAEYWVTPIDPKMSAAQGRLEAARVQQLHAEVAHHSRSAPRPLRAVRAREQHPATSAVACCARSSAMALTWKAGPNTSRK